jgi:hypothetical protein
MEGIDREQRERRAGRVCDEITMKESRMMIHITADVEVPETPPVIEVNTGATFVSRPEDRGSSTY